MLPKGVIYLFIYFLPAFLNSDVGEKSIWLATTLPVFVHFVWTGPRGIKLHVQFS